MRRFLRVALASLALTLAISGSMNLNPMATAQTEIEAGVCDRDCGCQSGNLKCCTKGDITCYDRG
jgi:hypothetical protein